VGAIKLGHVNVVRALLDLGAPVEQAEQGGLTPLVRAVLNNRVDIGCSSRAAPTSITPTISG
jgi:ankyrin repeat protein